VSECLTTLPADVVYAQFESLMAETRARAADAG